MNSAIEAYLKSPSNYKKGVELYSLHSKDKSLLALFSSGESSFTKRRLFEVLKVLSLQSVPKSEVKSKLNLPDIGQYTDVTESKFISIDYHALPQHIKKRFDHKRALFRQAKDAHFRLPDLTITEEQRAELAFTILDNFDEIQDIFNEAEDYQERGITREAIPNSTELEKMTALELSTLRNNYQKHIYKLKGIQAKQEKYIDIKAKLKEVENALQKR
jgi:hypothetical protein